MPKHKVTALVTGASAGLGVEFCRQLAPLCDVIIAVARRKERLEALASELSDSVEVHCLEADLGTVEGVARTMEAVRQQGPVDYLVNNAGFSTFGNFDQLPIDRQRAHGEACILTPASLCAAQRFRLCASAAGAASINVSSVATFVPSKGVAVYGATKAFLNYYSQALQVGAGGLWH